MSKEKSVVDRFTRYLNGPLGKSVKENMEDGESFNLQTSEFLLRITRNGEKMVVEIIDRF